MRLETATPANPLSRMKKRLADSWVLAFLAIEFIFFCVQAPGFASVDIVQLIFFYGTEVFLLSVAELFVIISGGIDLSVGFVLGFASIVSSKLFVLFTGLGLPPPLAIALGCLATLAAGAVPGLVNGYLVAYLGVPPFIATFSMLGVCRGVSELIIQGVYAMNLPELAGSIGSGYFIYAAPGGAFSFFVRPAVERGVRVWEFVPNIVVAAFAFIAIAAFALKRSRFGLHVYAIGGNKDAALRAGINVKKRLLAVYALSSVFASLAGLSYSFKYVSGKADAGASLLLDAIAAVVIGGASMFGGSGTVWRTITGCLIIAVLETGLRIQGTPTFDKYILVGVILVLAVIIEGFMPKTKE